MYFIAGNPEELLFSTALKTGKLVSPAFTNLLVPNAGSVSLYQVLHADREKEATFEKIREKHYPNSPTRLGALYLFQDVDSAHKANEVWWQGKRHIYGVDIVLSHSQLLADSNWLNCKQENWGDNAHSYFKGLHTETPLLEVLLVGVANLRNERFVLEQSSH